MKLLDLPMRLAYLVPHGTLLFAKSRAHLEQDWYHNWLDGMVRDNPDTIFFLVTDSTDVFEHEEPEIDYNTIVSMGDHGVLQHTYSNHCKPECYGQLDDCYYKKVHNA